MTSQHCPPSDVIIVTVTSLPVHHLVGHVTSAIDSGLLSWAGAIGREIQTEPITLGPKFKATCSVHKFSVSLVFVQA